jgi:hypothetical protein
MIMDGAPTAVTGPGALGEQSGDSHIEHVRQRLALLEVVKAGIEELKRDPATRAQLPVTDPADRAGPAEPNDLTDPNDPAVARAAANIALWRSYLPEDCVAAMITAGWHWST